MISDLYRHTNTIWPHHLRRDARKTHDPYDLADALRACKSFNDHSPFLIVDGKNRDEIYARRGYDPEESGRIEVVFTKNNQESTDKEAWYDIELEIWLGAISHSHSHRLVLGINGRLVRPYQGNEWMKFKTGPHKEGTVLHFHLLYDESIPRLLHWEREALDKIECIDAALARYRLSYTEQTITVTETTSARSADLPECGVLGDNHGGAARILLPEWFKVGTLELGIPDVREPIFTLPISIKHPKAILTPRKLKRKGVPINKEVVVKIHPTDYVIFY